MMNRTIHHIHIPDSNQVAYLFTCSGAQMPAAPCMQVHLYVYTHYILSLFRALVVNMLQFAWQNDSPAMQGMETLKSLLHAWAACTECRFLLPESWLAYASWGFVL